MTLVLGAVGLGRFSGLGPVRLAAGERAEAALESEKARVVERRREEMVRKEASLRSPLGREATARERGFLKPGESAAPPLMNPDPE